MILTITINPAVDKSTSVDKFIPEKKLRATQMIVEPGGGGINVTKALHELGENSTALFFSGGLTGQALENLLNAKQIDFKAIRIKGETRENITVLETSSNNQFRFVLPGPQLLQHELQQLPDLVEILKPSIVVVSGSLAPGMDDEFIAKIAAITKRCNAKIIADTSGKPLQMALDEGLYLIKPNINELASLVNKGTLGPKEVHEAALQVLSQSNCEMIAVSMGSDGAMLITKNDHVQIKAPEVEKKSTVGAGDSMVAGMTYMINKNASIKEILAFGVACGTAATMNEGSQLFKKNDVSTLFNQIMQGSN
jgi:6-phosphofructokinase 2